MMAAKKKKSTGKKPVSDAVTRRYRIDESFPMGTKGFYSQRYDRLTGGDVGSAQVSKTTRPGTQSQSWGPYYFDKKTASRAKGNTRKSVSPKRKSK
jgi:hypothetical protein